MSILNKAYRDDMFEVRHLVDEEHHGLRLDQYIQIYLDSFSRELIKKKIKKKKLPSKEDRELTSLQVSFTIKMK